MEFLKVKSCKKIGDYEDWEKIGEILTETENVVTSEYWNDDGQKIIYFWYSDYRDFEKAVKKVEKINPYAHEVLKDILDDFSKEREKGDESIDFYLLVG